MSQPKDDAENYAEILGYAEQQRFQVPGMSQERTEQRAMTEIREAFYRMIKGEHSLHVPPQPDDEDFVIGAALDELEAARGEIDRLNAVITDLLEDMKKIAAPYPGVSSPPALERRLIAVKALQRNGVEL